MTKIYTSQYGYKGQNRLDITVKGKDPFGKLYAPTWEMVMKVKQGRLSSDEYTVMYYALMRERYKQAPEKFKQILNRDSVVLVCFEKPEAGFCHRYILANILSQLGGEYKGELNTDGSSWGTPDLSRFNDPAKPKS